MAVFDPYEQLGVQPEAPGSAAAQPPFRSAPLGPDQPADQPVPQAQPVPPVQAPPRALPVPQVQPGGVGSFPVADGGAALAVRPPEEDPPGRARLSSMAIHNSPPWLVSMAVHMVLLIVLGLLVIAVGVKDRVSLEVQPPIDAEELGDQLEFESLLGQDDTDRVDEPVITPDDLPEVADPFATPGELAMLDIGNVATSDIRADQIGLALSGRQPGSKESLLRKYGGTHLTEAAVERGLGWLARNQLRDGSWSLARPYRDGVDKASDDPAAATAMALLAMQGAGHTHRKGKFKRNVVRGWNWMLDQQLRSGCFYQEGPINHRFYAHAQGTIAICELFAMTKDPEYEEPARRAVEYCLKSQSPKGGWRYQPCTDSDVSVTGWVVMALQSARMAGLEVPEENLSRVERYLDQAGRQNGSRYPYQSGSAIRLSMTAEALLMRQYLGWPQDHPALVDGLAWITQQENLVDYDRGRDVYYWYYATQAAHHMGGDYWKRWNEVMRRDVPRQQIKTGRETGSWDPQRPTLDRWASHGGRLYVTCLSIYMLEVYYRHLPIYEKVYTRFLKSGRTPGR